MARLREISAREADAMVSGGARMVDIREQLELASGMIPDAAHAPLSRFAHVEIRCRPDQPLIFYCRSGGRTKLHSATLEAKAGAHEAYVLRGGVEAWRAAGLPLVRPG